MPASQEGVTFFPGRERPYIFLCRGKKLCQGVLGWKGSSLPRGKERGDLFSAGEGGLLGAASARVGMGGSGCVCARKGRKGERFFSFCHPVRGGARTDGGVEFQHFLREGEKATDPSSAKINYGKDVPLADRRGMTSPLPGTRPFCDREKKEERKEEDACSEWKGDRFISK